MSQGVSLGNKSELRNLTQGPNWASAEIYHPEEGDKMTITRRGVTVWTVHLGTGINHRYQFSSDEEASSWASTCVLLLLGC